MRITYEFQTVARCPVDDAVTIMDVTVGPTDRLIEVESILAKVRKATRQPIMQEPFTENLAQSLDATVTTVGIHSGVRITCSA